MSVTDLASRYEPADAPLSPRLRAGQSLPPLDTARAPKEAYQERTSPTTHRRMLGSDEERRQRQQERQQQQQQRSSEDIAVLERKVKEQELHVREQELEARSRELDRERARLQSLREDDASPALVMRPRERRTSLRHRRNRSSHPLTARTSLPLPPHRLLRQLQSCPCRAPAHRPPCWLRLLRMHYWFWSLNRSLVVATTMLEVRQ